MSIRRLIEGDCGGVSPLVQLGGQFTRDAARKDEGLPAPQFGHTRAREDNIVNEYLMQISAPPQSFQMETLLQEMREIEQVSGSQTQIMNVPRINDEVTRNNSEIWAKEFGFSQALDSRNLLSYPLQNIKMQFPYQQQRIANVSEFFDEIRGSAFNISSGLRYAGGTGPCLDICPPCHPPILTEKFFETVQQNTTDNQLPKESTEDWINDYQNSNEETDKTATRYNEKFWNRLQEEWQKLSEQPEHPLHSEFNEQYDPYNEYLFVERNPMSEVNDAFEKGKEFLAKGDIPNAVLCFEVAAKKDPENAEIWEHLGISQAENEMDPQSIAALKRSLELKPDNLRVLMSLAVAYTNESLQNNALKMLMRWLEVNPKYRDLVGSEENSELWTDAGFTASSLICGNHLQKVQNIFLQAVRQQPNRVDADVQEALGVLYNLSSEYDKAVDCFRAALEVQPNNAKIWNRLGASLANGSRSVEAVQAYQHALALEPGFIRVRYNVGVCCMNLKAYKESAEHLLTALNMQANSISAIQDRVDEKGSAAAMPASMARNQQQMSEGTWSTLKMVLSLMGRNDLQTHVNKRNLEALNKAFQ